MANMIFYQFKPAHGMKNIILKIKMNLHAMVDRFTNIRGGKMMDLQNRNKKDVDGNQTYSNVEKEISEEGAGVFISKKPVDDMHMDSKEILPEGEIVDGVEIVRINTREGMDYLYSHVTLSTFGSSVEDAPILIDGFARKVNVKRKRCFLISANLVTEEYIMPVKQSCKDYDIICVLEDDMDLCDPYFLYLIYGLRFIPFHDLVLNAKQKHSGIDLSGECMLDMERLIHSNEIYYNTDGSNMAG